jgi:hypothetical protein
MLAVDTLDDVNIKPFVYNDDLIYNFTCLADDKIIRQRDNFKTEQHIDRVKIVRELITNLGFVGLLDSEGIDEATFNTNFESIKTTTFKNYKKVCELFSLHKNYSVSEQLTNKQMLGLLNSILEGFSISIKTNRKRVKKNNELFSINTYQLCINNDLVEIVKRRHNKGYLVIDTNNILNLPKPEVYFIDSEEEEPFPKGKLTPQALLEEEPLEFLSDSDDSSCSS